MPYSLVVVGASLGGTHAITALLNSLPQDFPLPLAIVQHRGKDSDGTLQAVFQRASTLPVIEVEDKQPITAGAAYLAPADYHLLVECDTFALSTDEPVLYARPSIDVLFESAADAYGAGVIGIILTGASADGARGLAAIKSQQGIAVVQEPATAECSVMPAAALGAVGADFVVPLIEIAPLLIKLSHVLQR